MAAHDQRIQRWSRIVNVMLTANAGAQVSAAHPPGAGVLKDIRVLDLSWGIAGPMTTMLRAAA